MVEQNLPSAANQKKKKRTFCLKKYARPLWVFFCLNTYLPWSVVVQQSAVLPSGLLLLFDEEVHSLSSRTSWPREKRTQNFNNGLNLLNAESTQSWKHTELLGGGCITFPKEVKDQIQFPVQDLGSCSRNREQPTLKFLLPLVDAHQVPAISICFLPAYLCQISWSLCGSRLQEKSPGGSWRHHAQLKPPPWVFPHSVSDWIPGCTSIKFWKFLLLECVSCTRNINTYVLSL